MTKKLFGCIIIILVLFSFSMTASAIEIPSKVRVGLYFGASAQKSVTVSADGGFEIGVYDNCSFAQVIDSSAQTLTVKVGAKSDEIEVLDGDTVIYTSDDKEVGLGIRQKAGREADKCITINDSKYRGAVNFRRFGDNMAVINIVDMDKYLYGVVSREMSPSWNIEALKAQSVCARNFASNHLNKHAEFGFDVCNSVDCQAYSGIKSESENSTRAVDETSGEILVYAGAPAELYYAASMGNCTEDVKNVWGNSVPYLKSADNSYENTEEVTNGKWMGTLTREEATTIMRNKGYDVGDVTSIEAIEYTPAGRVLKLKVTGTSASKVFERSACRTIFNTVAKSQMYTVHGNTQKLVEIAVCSGSGESILRSDKMLMLSASGAAQAVHEDIYASNGVYQRKFTQGTSAENTSFTFEGTGWGHSVGMSQYGAKGMAEAGFDYKEILDNYFEGTTLEKVY